MQYFLSLWKATFYLLVFVLVLHLGALLKTYDVALSDTVPTPLKKDCIFPNLYDLIASQKVMCEYEHTGGTR